MVAQQQANAMTQHGVDARGDNGTPSATEENIKRREREQRKRGTRCMVSCIEATDVCLGLHRAHDTSPQSLSLLRYLKLVLSVFLLYVLAYHFVPLHFLLRASYTTSSTLSTRITISNMIQLDPSHDLAIPNGSIVVVTGANGYIASHICAEFLALGYKVRGTVRNSEKAELTTRALASSNYEAFVVPDMTVSDAFDTVVKGANAFVHVASVLTFDSDPNKVIPPTVEGTMIALRAAAKEKSVVGFIYTSSAMATTMPRPSERFHINSQTWNDEAVKVAWRPPPYEAERAWYVFAASKVEAERAIWKFVEEERPGLIVNTVNSDTSFGKILLDQPTSTGKWVPSLVQGDMETAKSIPPSESTGISGMKDMDWGCRVSNC